MPIQLEEDPQAELAVDEPQRPILIVEDDASLAEVLAIRLERQGFCSMWAETGKRALEIARTHRPRLVILDLRLPDVDGFQVCQRLEETPETCGIPIIILSGMERPDIVRRARAAGCRYYVRKPYDPNALLILIEHAIRDEEDPHSF